MSFLPAVSPPRPSAVLWSRLSVAALALVLAACAGGPSGSAARRGASAAAIPDLPRTGGKYYKDDGPGDDVPDSIHTLEDAVVRDEPVHRATSRPYTVFGRRYVPQVERAPFRERGRASWYGRKFHGNTTANGERYDMYAMTAAHKTLPLPSFVRVVNLVNGRSVVVRVNDRGPFHPGRVIDLSYAAAFKLGFLQDGSTPVEIEALMVDPSAPVFAQSPPSEVIPEIASTASTPAPLSPPGATPPAAAASAIDPAAILNGEEAPGDVASVPEPDADSAAPAEAGVYLQLGAFRTRDNAEGFRGYVAGELAWLRDRLAVLGDADSDGYRLHAGPYASAEVARAVAEKINETLKLRPFVVVR